MKEQLIKLLQRKWVTPLVALNEAQCLSLSQRCGDFRRSGLNVVDRWVKTPSGKRVKAYRIV
jgi:Helix-turn-helix domain